MQLTLAPTAIRPSNTAGKKGVEDKQAISIGRAIQIYMWYGNVCLGE